MGVAILAAWMFAEGFSSSPIWGYTLPFDGIFPGLYIE